MEKETLKETSATRDLALVRELLKSKKKEDIKKAFDILAKLNDQKNYITLPQAFDIMTLLIDLAEKLLQEEEKE